MRRAAALCLFMGTSPINFGLLIKDDSKIKREKNINRRGQRHVVNVWHLSDPLSFSLPTTFKVMLWYVAD
jgi:hypothetical protein